MSQIVPSMKPVFQGPLNIDVRVKARCAACQLQICKSRVEPPHAGLKEIERDQAKNSAMFSCEACSVSLLWSGDFSRPGWSQARS